MGVKYMRLWEELADARLEGQAEGFSQGHESGVEEERIASIRNLMESTGWPAEKAMEVLKVPAEEREKYLKMV